jgi:uncharacterized protein with HEPN domain
MTLSRDRYLVDEMKLHLDHIREVAAEGKEAIEQDWGLRAKLDHSIEQLAEAAEKMSNAFKTANPGIDWKSLRRLRRGIAHSYDLEPTPVVLDEMMHFAGDVAEKMSRRLSRPRFD